MAGTTTADGHRRQHPGRAATVPALGFSYSGRDPVLAERLVPIVDHLEIAPDDLVRIDGDRARLDPDIVAHLRDLAPDTTYVVHGVGLSIGTATGMSPTYLGLLDQLLDHIDIGWHSEHLGYTTVDGHFLGTMLTLPRTDEALDLVAGRVQELQARYRVPFLLENVAGLLPDPGGPWSPAAFLNELAGRTGCGILLDAYNLECDRTNTGLDVDAFLAEIRYDRVAEIHVAGGVRQDGFQLDVHSRRPAPSTLALAQRILGATSGAGVPAATAAPAGFPAPTAARAGFPAPTAARARVTFELLPQAVHPLGHDGIVGALAELRSLLAPGGAGAGAV